MVRENNADANKTWVYTYDLSGNITSKKEYAYTTGSLPSSYSQTLYSYSSGTWGDLLTNYNGTAISYDSIGNPTNWRNASSLTWDGRRLTNHSVSSSTEWLDYTYNSSGIRTRKYYINYSTYHLHDHTYVLDGTNIIKETIYNDVIGAQSTDTLYYYYDESGVCGFEYNGTPYYFLKNIQGDVISILNASGQLVVSYTYDAWGKVLSTAGTLASTVGKINPFRYRGYYYDSETGFYYVSSRYYDPEVGRWISADDTECLGVEEDFVSYNLFSYCLNNPVNRTDINGNWSLPNWAKVTIGAVATVAAVAVTVATGGAAAPVLYSVAASTIGGAVTSAISHRVTTGSWEGAGKAALDGAANGFMTGGLCALGGSVIGGAVRTVKNAKSGITIGKVGEFEKVAEIANTRHYEGLKEFKLVEKVFGTKAAEAVGWWQNKCVIKGVMALKGAIYDCGGQLTGAYAKEVALTKGYAFLYNVWVI